MENTKIIKLHRRLFGTCLPVEVIDCTEETLRIFASWCLTFGLLWCYYSNCVPVNLLNLIRVNKVDNKSMVPVIHFAMSI